MVQDKFMATAYPLNEAEREEIKQKIKKLHIQLLKLFKLM
jgi:hypothetical protein